MIKNLSQALTLLKNSSFLMRGLLLLAIGCAAIQFFLLLPRTFNRKDPWRDVFAYYLATERIHNGEPVYISQPKSGPHDRSYPLYLYPPIFAIALSTLPEMSFTAFARLWTLLLYGAFWIYAATLGKLASGRWTASGTLIAGMVLLVFPGTFRALDLGQVDPLLWAAFGLALSFPSLRGVFTTSISIVKPWGIWPLLGALGEGCRVWCGAMLVLAGSALFGTLVLGGTEFAGSCQNWFTKILPSLSQGAWSPYNRSLSFALLRFSHDLGLWEYGGGSLPVWAKNWLLACSAAGPLLAGWCLRRQTGNLQLAAMGCGAILFSPVCWTTYLPVLLSFIAVLFHDKPARK
jgi:hypothetical protein